MMKKNRIKTTLLPVCLCALLLTACGNTNSTSASADTYSVTSANSWASEAYASIEDPLLRGEGKPSYWSPLYLQTEDSSFVSSIYAVTDVTLETVTYGTQMLYKLDGSDYLISKPDEEDENAKIAMSNRAKELLQLQ